MAPGRRGLVLLLIHAALMQIIIFGMRPSLSYAALGLGASPAALGVLSAFYALPALFLALPAGRVVDLIGERRGMVIGAVTVAAAAGVAVAGHGSLALLIAASVLLGCGQMFTVLGEQSYVGAISTAGRSDTTFGIYGFAVAFGQTVGPALLVLPGGTPQMPPVGLIFAVSLGCAALMLIVSVLIRSPARAVSPDRQGMLRAARGVLSTAGLPNALIAGSLVLASVDIFIAYAPLVGQDRGLPAAVISLMLIARSGFSMFSRLFLGPLSRTFGRRWLLVGSILGSALMLGAFVFDLPAGVLIAFACGYGFVIGICQPITMSWISLIAPTGTRALAMSMRLAANRLGQTVLPASLGLLAAAAGAAGVLGASSVMLLIAAAAGLGVPSDPAAGTVTDKEPS
ncbi:MFS transporter [Microbacterium horticulturae]|uniref:MFS transporter n=1 Tax=Microbacterium horticulturae TaxID=3028316 RepID=A0ABY8BV12_9MICO|nr:MFS transporter [Microbacterium sp. KACC 23027]WEG08009.1 MFS transporter [Microbacterium sp. KACC 23027]